MELIFLIPVVGGIPDSLTEFRIPRPRIPDSTSKHLPGIQSLDYLTRGRLYFPHYKTLSVSDVGFI